MEYRVVMFQSEIEGLIIRANFGKKRITNFCNIYRPHSQTNDNFLQAFENLLEFLWESKNDTILCGDFNIDKSKDSRDKFGYEKLLVAFDLKKHHM